MKTSEVIKNLQHSVETYGDLDFSVSISEDKLGLTPNDRLYFGYDQLPQQSPEINVRDFPY